MLAGSKGDYNVKFVVFKEMLKAKRNMAKAKGPLVEGRAFKCLVLNLLSQCSYFAEFLRWLILLIWRRWLESE